MKLSKCCKAPIVPRNTPANKTAYCNGCLSDVEPVVTSTHDNLVSIDFESYKKAMQKHLTTPQYPCAHGKDAFIGDCEGCKKAIENAEIQKEPLINMSKNRVTKEEVGTLYGFKPEKFTKDQQKAMHDAVKDVEPTKFADEKYGYGIKDLERDFQEATLGMPLSDIKDKKLLYINMVIDGKNERYYSKEATIDECIEIIKADAEKVIIAYGDYKDGYYEGVQDAIYSLEALKSLKSKL